MSTGIRERSSRLSRTDWLPTLAAVFALLVVSAPVLVPLGMHAADEGYVLAGARRILRGQLPHRDFISTRPPLSQLLHLPELLIAPGHVVLVSRVVALAQFAAIALAAVLAAQAVLAPERRLPPLLQAFAAALAFFGCLNVFPLMAWHSTDAVMLASIGAFLVVYRAEEPRRQWPGYLLLGLAYLARQNFALVAPAALLLFGGWRRARNWIATLAPGLAYCAYILAFGLVQPVREQLLARTEFATAGLLPLVRPMALLGLALGLAAAYVLFRGRLPRVAVRAAAIVVAVGSIAGVIAINAPVHQEFGWFIPGLLGGLILGSLSVPAADDWRRYAALTWVVGWSSGVSLGWNYPTLFAGALLIACLVVPRAVASPSAARLDALYPALALAVVAVVLAARFFSPEGEVPACRMRFRLSRVSPALAGIRTNNTLGAQLLDLERVEARVRKPYVLLPSFPVNWLIEDQPNLLVTDYPADSEMASKALSSRVIASVDALRGRATFIVFKYPPELAFHVDDGERIPDLPVDSVVKHVRDTFHKQEETEYLEVYR